MTNNIDQITDTYGPEFAAFINMIRAEVNACDDPDELLDIGLAIVHVLDTTQDDQDDQDDNQED